MTTTFRSDTRQAMYDLLVSFKDDNPSLRQVHKARPPDMGACPAAYVGTILEPRIAHDSGVRQRDIDIPVTLVDEISDNEETADRLDSLTDLLLDALTAEPHAVSNLTVQSPVRIDGGEINVGGVVYAATVIIVRAQIQEGRT